MIIAVNSNGRRVILSQGRVKLNLPTGELLFIGLPTSIFKIEIEECYIYRDKFRVVHIGDGVDEICVEQLAYNRILASIERSMKIKKRDKPVQLGRINYKEFIGGYCNHLYRDVIILKDGSIAYDIKENEKLIDNDCMRVNLSGLQGLISDNEKQQKTISELRMRMI